MLPKHEYGENVANNDDQGLEHCSKYNYNKSSIVQDSSFELAWYLTENLAGVRSRLSSGCPVLKV